MKKTLIAAGIAAIVAAPVAMADVSVTGQVKYTLKWVDGHNGAAGTAGEGFSDNNVTFKSSEDLGNGLTAFAQLALDTDNAGGSSDEKDAKVGIKGSFGTIVAGRMEYLTEGVASAKMDDGLSGHSNNYDQIESNLTSFGRDNAIAYVSPTVNGFHVAVAGSQSGTTGGAFDNRDILVAYDNGPLSVIVTNADVAESVNGANDGYDVTTAYASYTMGDIRVSGQHVKKDYDDTTTDLKDNILRLDYTMGNNVFTIANKSADDNYDVTLFKATHKFSKRTAAYAGVRNKDNKGDVTFVGMVHKF